VQFPAQTAQYVRLEATSGGRRRDQRNYWGAGRGLFRPTKQHRRRRGSGTGGVGGAGGASGRGGVTGTGGGSVGLDASADARAADSGRGGTTWRVQVLAGLWTHRESAPVCQRGRGCSRRQRRRSRWRHDSERKRRCCCSRWRCCWRWRGGWQRRLIVHGRGCRRGGAGGFRGQCGGVDGGSERWCFRRKRRRQQLLRPAQTAVVAISEGPMAGAECTDHRDWRRVDFALPQTAPFRVGGGQDMLVPAAAAKQALVLEVGR